LPHFIIRFRTVPLQKYSICSIPPPERLRGLVGMRGLFPVRSADGFSGEAPFTFVAVAPPRTIPTKTDFDTFNRLIDASDFHIRFDEGTLLDGRNTRTVSGFYVLPDPKALAELLAASLVN
jgi:hypothetical protein